MKFCAVIWGPKSKIEFVWDKNLITPSPILLQFFKNLHYGLCGLTVCAFGCDRGLVTWPHLRAFMKAPTFWCLRPTWSERLLTAAAAVL